MLHGCWYEKKNLRIEGEFLSIIPANHNTKNNTSQKTVRKNNTPRPGNEGSGRTQIGQSSNFNFGCNARVLNLQIIIIHFK